MTTPAPIDARDLTTMIFLIWEDEPAARPGHRPSLAARLAPARARFLAKFGRPPTLALLPGPEPADGIDLPVRVYRGVGRRQVWLGGPAAATPARRRPRRRRPPGNRASHTPANRRPPRPGAAGIDRRATDARAAVAALARMMTTEEHMTTTVAPPPAAPDLTPLAAALTPLLPALQALEAELNTLFIERQGAVRAILVALLARQHCRPARPARRRQERNDRRARPADRRRRRRRPDRLQSTC